MTKDIVVPLSRQRNGKEKRTEPGWVWQEIEARQCLGQGEGPPKERRWEKRTKKQNGWEMIPCLAM